MEILGHSQISVTMNTYSHVTPASSREAGSSFSVRRSPSMDRKRKLRDGSPLRTRRLTCPGTRSTSGPSMPRPGCPSTAPTTGCARSTATNPGTMNCAPKPPGAAVLACMPTPRTIRGCRSDQLCRHIPSRPRCLPTARTADVSPGGHQQRRDRADANPLPDHRGGQADGYGHGAITVAQAAIAAGAEWLGTTDIAEAPKLRRQGSPCRS